MKIITSASQASTEIAKLQASGKTIGLVPTLGGLHKGHQLLMQRSSEENDITVISIFLNPMQFRKKQFLEYPSDFEQDKLIAQKTNVSIIFHPSVKEMYPNISEMDDFFKYQTDFKRRDEKKFVIEDNIIHVASNLVYHLDGKIHPWVFDGSTTIVSKLFKVLHPNRAYFGEKDFQQLAILTKMAAIYFPKIKVLGVPTLRDADGLAFSSRNVLLSDTQRQSALCVCHALQSAENMIKTGETEAKIVLDTIIKAISPLVKIDYIDIINKKTLEPITKISDDIVLYVAFFLNEIRLTETVIVSIHNS